MDTGLAGSIGSWAADHPFEAFYSGTLQKNDDNKIPPKSKPVPGVYNRVKINLIVAQTGVDVDFILYKNGVEVDTFTVTDGDDDSTFLLDDPLTVAADDVITWEIDWTGSPATLGVSASMRLSL